VVVGKKRTRTPAKHPFGVGLLCLAALAVFVSWPKWWPLVEAHALHLFIIGVIVVAIFLVRMVRRFKLASSMTEIDAMSGHEFERYLVRLFKRLGYRARNVGASGADFGADLVIEKGGVRTAVQAKNYCHGRVGNDAVQQAIAGATYYDCQRAMVVTNARYTKAAREQADHCALIPVILWNRKDLERVLGG
jgi:restriction system protein